MRRVRLDYPRLTCDRCGASQPIKLPVTADAMIRQVREWQQAHEGCGEVAGG